jgi:hypothetical protein
MIVDVLYRAGDGKRHGWRINVRNDARPYVITVWGQPEFFGLNIEKAITEALCRNKPVCSRVIVIVWSNRMKKRQILVGQCRHQGQHRRATIEAAAG